MKKQELEILLKEMEEEMNYLMDKQESEYVLARYNAILKYYKRLKMIVEN